MVPVRTRDLGGEVIQTINARDVHAGLMVKTRFADWVKRQLIEPGRFIEGVDFFPEKVVLKPEKNRGGRPALDYHLTLDTAEHLALLENNPQGHAYRQRLIDIKKAYRQAQLTAVHGETLDMKRIGGMVKAIVRKEVAALLTARLAICRWRGR